MLTLTVILLQLISLPNVGLSDERRDLFVRFTWRRGAMPSGATTFARSPKRCR